MMLALTNASVFDGASWLVESAVLIVDGRITGIVGSDADIPAGAVVEDLQGAMLVPGFVDVQVNGGGGVMFNTDRTPAALAQMVAGHRRYGSTTLMPTVITEGDEVMDEAAEAVRTALAEGVPGIRGVHFEGPCLSPARKGVHNPDFFRPLNQGLEALYSASDLGRVIVTLAPECVPASTISRLAEKGVLICAGHTAGTYEEVQTALGAGLRGFTHLYNAMTPMTNREPGVVGAALDDAESWIGLIADNFHLHPATARNAIRSKAAGKMMLVTDAMATVGAEEKSFDLYGVTVFAHGGRITLEDGTLAGSDLDMMSAVRNAHQTLGVSLEEALRMASLYPAQFLRLDDEIGKIAPGYAADLAAIDPETLTVKRTWIAGRGEDAY